VALAVSSQAGATIEMQVWSEVLVVAVELAYQDLGVMENSAHHKPSSKGTVLLFVTEDEAFELT